MIIAIIDFFSNIYIWAAIISWFTAQFIKIIITYVKERKFCPSLLSSTGGMPSAHSATISGLTFSIGKYAGFSSAAFAISFIVAIIVVTDALHLRREVGRHSEALQKITGERFNEKSGHKLSEVIIGILIGMAIGLLI
ncbi:divergent PAP2 family protein [Athalassotoga sp.]|uniref:divergent PAP2 family protein n=1 Tax=Athalassotoga sp. TaxID=2022597 RepID=UPI003D08FE4C